MANAMDAMSRLRKLRVPAALQRCVLFALLWSALAGTSAWNVGAPAVSFATAVSVWLAPQRAHWRLLPALRFLGYFVIESLTAGFDVALRGFSPRPRLAPAMLHYQLQLPAGAARVLFASVVNLVPGTLCVDIDDERLCAHVLDADQPVADRLLVLEQRVGAVFGIDIQPPGLRDSEA